MKGERIIKVKDIKIGKEFVVIAGPCSIESYGQLLQTAKFVKQQGAKILRGVLSNPGHPHIPFKDLERRE